MECFGDSSDDDDEAGNETAIKRDESCGLCCFHPNTEASLLNHVRNSLKTVASSTTLPDEQNKLERSRERSSSVLQAIDTFCMSRHWMMHVGPEKGDILLNAMQDAMNNKMKDSPLEYNIPFVAVELGTYCGYASILMGQTFCKSKPATMNCHLFTTEIHPEYAEIATEMIQLSGMEDLISVHQISYNGHDTDLVSVVGDAMKKSNPQNSSQATKIDFLFIDHDKDAYKTDLCKIEASGMICRGTKVVADNVLFANIDDYVGYVQQRKKEGIVETRTIPCHVEYSGDNNETGEDHQDGVEITDYLRDP
mmetsp:Transcript_28725/g.61248  ORF Transcript_28725/g.61248 Transcript_28725/m.61248 type:complete len:308 (+) Transcript_28725:142-1065(+)